jgi:hypothetical protein
MFYLRGADAPQLSYDVPPDWRHLLGENRILRKTYNTEHVALQFEQIATRLANAADEAKATAFFLRMWLLPNLGLQTIHQGIVRELERANDAR